MYRLSLNSKYINNNLGEYNGKLHPKLAYEICAQTGATDEKLARIFRVDPTRVEAWKSRFPVFGKAVRKGRDEYDTREVESAILKRAKGYQYKETKTERIFVRRKVEGGNGKKGKYEMVPGVKVTETLKTLPPDVGAAQWWLEIRNPERWPSRALKVEKTEHKELTVRFGVEQLKELDEGELKILKQVSDRLAVIEAEEEEGFDVDAAIEQRSENARRLLDRLGSCGEDAS